MFSDELIGLELGHRRQMRNMGRNAQAVVDEMAAEARQLRRQLAAAQTTNRDLVLERGRRNNAMLIARMSRRTH